MQDTFCATQIFLKSISVIQGTLKSKKIKSMLYIKRVTKVCLFSKNMQSKTFQLCLVKKNDSFFTKVKYKKWNSYYLSSKYRNSLFTKPLFFGLHHTALSKKSFFFKSRKSRFGWKTKWLQFLKILTTMAANFSIWLISKNYCLHFVLKDCLSLSQMHIYHTTFALGV